MDAEQEAVRQGSEAHAASLLWFSQHGHPLGLYSQREASWPFMRPVLAKKPCLCDVCGESALGDGYRRCTLGCGWDICGHCAERLPADEAAEAEWKEAAGSSGAALWEAAGAGDVKRIRELLPPKSRRTANSLSPDITGPWSYFSWWSSDHVSDCFFGNATALHLAAYRGQLAALKTLIERGAKLDAEGKGGETILDAAAQGGDSGVVSHIAKLFLDEGLRGLLSTGDWTPLRRVTADGHTDCVRALLDADPACAKHICSTGLLPLHDITSHTAAAIVEALLAAYGDAAKVKNKEGRLPLHTAVEAGASEAVVELLLAANASAAGEGDEGGRTPLHLLGAKSSRGVASALLHACPAAAKQASKAGAHPLHDAVAQGAPADVVAALLEAHPEAAKTADSFGRLPLHHARSDAGAAKVILDAHPEAVTTADNIGDLPLHHAVHFGASPEVIAVLLAANTDTAKVPGGHGHMPIGSVGSCSLPDVLPLLHAAYPEAATTVDAAGDVPLGRATCSSAECATALLRLCPGALLVISPQKASEGLDVYNSEAQVAPAKVLFRRLLLPHAPRESREAAATLLLAPLALRWRTDESWVELATTLGLRSTDLRHLLTADPLLRSGAALDCAMLALLHMITTPPGGDDDDEEVSGADAPQWQPDPIRLAEAVADVARGHRCSVLGTAAALQLLLKHCPVAWKDFPQSAWDVLGSATRFLASHHPGNAPVVAEAATSCAAFIADRLAQLPKEGHLRSAFLERQIAVGGTLFNLCRDSQFTNAPDGHLLTHLTGSPRNLVPQSIARLSALAVADPACAFAPLLWRFGKSSFRGPMTALLSGSLAAMLVMLSASSASGLEVARSQPAAAGPLPHHLRLTLCAALCLPKGDGASAEEWDAAKPLVQHLLAGDNLRDVVRAMGSLLLSPATAAAAGAAAQAQVQAQEHSPAASSVLVPPPGMIEWLLGPQETAEGGGLKYALKAALRSLACLANKSAAADGGGGRGDEPAAKWLKPNPPGSSDDLEASLLKAWREVPVRVRDEGTKTIFLKEIMFRRWLAPGSQLLRIFDVEGMGEHVLFRNWDSPHLPAESVEKYFLGAAKIMLALDHARDLAIPADLEPLPLYAMAYDMQFPALMDACFDKLILKDAGTLEAVTFFATRAAASVAPASTDGSCAAHTKRVLAACCPVLLRLAADDPAKWPAHLLVDVEGALVEAVAEALRRRVGEGEPPAPHAAAAAGGGARAGGGPN